jgi:hypothetical protein
MPKSRRRVNAKIAYGTNEDPATSSSGRCSNRARARCTSLATPCRTVITKVGARKTLIPDTAPPRLAAGGPQDYQPVDVTDSAGPGVETRQSPSAPPGSSRLPVAPDPTRPMVLTIA